MACSAATYGLRCTGHCFPSAHAQQNGPAVIPADGKLGVTSKEVALIFVYLLFLAQIEDTSARGGFIQPSPPESESTAVAGNCATHRVSVSYTTMYGTSVLDSVTIGRKAIPKAELDKINTAIAGNEIARIRWIECPISRSAESAFKLLFQLNRPGFGLEQRFRPIEITTRGEVKLSL